MSSWDAYIQTNLVGSQAVTDAGIYDLEGNPWAYSPNFAVRAAPAPAQMCPHILHRLVLTPPPVPLMAGPGCRGESCQRCAGG